MDGDGVVELGAGNALGNVGIADAPFGQPLAVAIEAKVVAVGHLVINRIPTEAIGEPSGVIAPTAAAKETIQPRRQECRGHGWPWIGGRGDGGIIEQEVENRFAKISRIAHPFGQLRDAAGGGMALQPAHGVETRLVASCQIIEANRRKGADKIGQMIALTVAIKGRLIAVAALFTGNRRRAERMEIGGETIVPKRIVAQGHDGWIGGAGGMQGEQELGDIPQRLWTVFQPFGQQAAAAIGADQVVKDVEMGTNDNVQIAVQLVIGIIRRVEGQRHHAQVAGMGGVIVVAAKAHLLLIRQQRRIIDQPHRFWVMIAPCDHLLRPAQEDLANGCFVLRREGRVDPIDHQREGFAVVANAVAIFGGKVGMTEGRVLGRFIAGVIFFCRRPFGGFIYDVHQQGARPIGVIGAKCGIILCQ